MQNIKSKLYDNLIKNNQPIKLYCIFLLSALLFKIFILIVQIFYPMPKWSDYDQEELWDINGIYWENITLLFLIIAFFCFMFFIFSNKYKIRNLKYIFLFLTLLAFEYAILPGPSFFYIFEFGQAPSSNKIIATIFVILIISLFFYIKMKNATIFQNQESDEKKLKKFIKTYIPILLIIHTILMFLLSYKY